MNIYFFIFFFIEPNPTTMAISCFFVCVGEEWLKRLVETHLYVWQGFVTKNPGLGDHAGASNSG